MDVKVLLQDGASQSGTGLLTKDNTLMTTLNSFKLTILRLKQVLN